MAVKTIKELKEIENQDSDRICEYCPLPIPNWEKKMGAYSHRECWKQHCEEVRENGDQGKSYSERQNKYNN